MSNEKNIQGIGPLRPDSIKLPELKFELPKFNPIFNYEVIETDIIDGKTVIKGTHKKIGGISEKLAKRLSNNGMPTTQLNKLLRKE